MRRAVIVLLGLVAGVLLVAALAQHGQIAALAAEAQRDFQNGLARGLRAIRAGQPGAWTGFLGLCFAYGFVHAVGPGHGKFLVGAWGMARPVGMTRLAAITLAASLGQAVTAVALVLIGVRALGLGRRHLTDLAERTLAPASLILIGLIGMWLVLRGLRRLARLRRQRAEAAATATATAQPGQNCAAPQAMHGGRLDRHGNAHCRGHHHDHAHPTVAQPTAAQPTTAQAHAAHPPVAQVLAAQPVAKPAAVTQPIAAHLAAAGQPAATPHPHLAAADHPAAVRLPSSAAPACPDCGHRHAPTLPEIAAATGPREVAALIGAIAIRPCSGAILLLVLTWQMGILPAGIAGAFAMATGTAALTIAVALASVAMRRGAAAGLASSPALRTASGLFELAAGLVVIAAVASGLGWI